MDSPVKRALINYYLLVSRSAILSSDRTEPRKSSVRKA